MNSLAVGAVLGRSRQRRREAHHHDDEDQDVTANSFTR